MASQEPGPDDVIRWMEHLQRQLDTLADPENDRAPSERAAELLRLAKLFLVLGEGFLTMASSARTAAAAMLPQPPDPPLA